MPVEEDIRTLNKVVARLDRSLSWKPSLYDLFARVNDKRRVVRTQGPHSHKNHDDEIENQRVHHQRYADLVVHLDYDAALALEEGSFDVAACRGVLDA